MNKLLKFIVFPIVGLIIVLIVAAYILVAVIDPNRYRAAIQSVVQTQTGLQAELAGEMSWTFRPTFGLELNDVRLSSPESRQELASFSRVALNINPAGLFSGQLNIEEFSATDLHINWFVDSQGNSNWPMPEPTETQPAPAAENSDTSVDLNISRFDISNASIDYRNAMTSQNFSLRNIDLRSRNSNFSGQSFPLNATVRMINEDTAREIAAELDMDTRLDLAAGTLSVEDMTLALSPLQLTGEVHLTGLNSDNLRWRAQLASNNFNLSYLLENFVAMDEDAMPAPDTQQIALQDFRANGDNSGATVSSVELRINEAPVSGRADVLFATGNRPMMIGYSLQGGNLDLDDWLAAGSSEETEIDSAPAEEAELPFDMLREINFRGEHQFDSLTASGFTLSPLQFTLLSRDGVMQIETQEAGFYDGAISLQGQVNASQQLPRIEMTTEMRNVSATAIAEDFPQLGFFTGRFNLTGNHTLSGTTTTALMNSIDGATQLQVEDSSVDITMVKEVFSAISVLNPEGNIAAQWPDVVRFTDAELLLMFNDGLAANQEISVRLDNLDINGTGGLNLAEGAFDYRMTVTMLGEPATQSIPIQERYQNIAWPVRCEAEFTDAALQYCRPDLQAVRQVFADMARNAVQQRANEVITEQVDRLRNRVQDFLQQN